MEVVKAQMEVPAYCTS